MQTTTHNVIRMQHITLNTPILRHIDIAISHPSHLQRLGFQAFSRQSVAYGVKEALYFIFYPPLIGVHRGGEEGQSSLREYEISERG